MATNRSGIPQSMTSNAHGEVPDTRGSRPMPSAFFAGLSRTAVRIGNHDLAVPFFVQDASAMTAVFPAHLGALRRLMPDPRFVPARLTPGLGIVAITGFEYRETDVGPYNEIAISVVLNDPPFGMNVPGRALFAQHRRRQYHVFIHRLPVTTEIAAIGGEYCAFPKFVADIGFSESSRERTSTLMDGDGCVLTLHGPKISTTRSEELQAFVHLWMDRQPQCVEFRMNAVRFGETVRPGAAWVELADSHPIAVELATVLASRSALCYRHVDRLQAIEFGPEHYTLPLLMKGLELVAARSPDRAQGHARAL